jgi:hypothetical protein
VTGYRLDDQGIMVRSPAGAINFSFLHRAQAGCGAYSAFYIAYTGASSPG